MASVSVAMCTYNGAAFLEQQLRSILAQTLAPCEIVICDDCSTDRTLEIAQRLAADSPVPVQVHANEANLGVGRNFQKAMALCRGELIALSDQDDWWHPRKLEVLSQAMAHRPEAAYAFSDARLTDAELRPMEQGLWDLHLLSPARQRQLEGEDALEALSVANYATGATMMVRRTWLGHVLPVSPHWFHDGWLSLMLSAFAHCVCVGEKLVDYRQHAAQKIGACRRSELGQLKWQRVMNRAFLQRDAARWADAYAHLAARKHLMRRPADLELIRQRAMLDRDRLMLRENPELRFGLVAEHLMQGDYHRYAWGTTSAMVDLLWHE